MIRSAVNGWLPLMLALLLLLLPMQWVFAAILAAAFHELCHWIAVHLCGGSVSFVRMGATGAKMEFTGLTLGKELICALAGPAGSLMLLLFAKCFPRVAVCAGLQGLYNLLPVYPLDGGRILRCGAQLLLGVKTGHFLCCLLERLCLLGLLLLGTIAGFRLHLGFTPLLIAVCVILRAYRGKNTLQTVGKFGTID